MRPLSNLFFARRTINTMDLTTTFLQPSETITDHRALSCNPAKVSQQTVGADERVAGAVIFIEINELRTNHSARGFKTVPVPVCFTAVTALLRPQGNR